MKKILIAAIAAMPLLNACTGAKETGATEETCCADTTIVANANINGKWNIESIVLGENETVRPAEAAPDAEQYIEFTDSTYAIATNCNSMSGSCTVVGDSIFLGDGPATLMACENMETEDALRKILPSIATVTVENDSTIRLNGTSANEYIELRRATVAE